MAISKVVYGNQTLIDITDTDASATTVQSGKKFYNSAGELVTGTGSALGHEIETLANGGTAHYISGIDLGSDTVDASHLFSGYTAHNKNGEAITGTMTGAPLTMGTIRPDAELVTNFTYDRLWVNEDAKTIPAYTTQSTTIYTAAALTPTVALNLDNYNYYILFRCLTTPIYNDTTKSAARQDYSMTSAAYEIVDIPANTIQSISGTKFGTRASGVFATGAAYRMPYWSNATTIKLSTASSYGVHQTVAAPTLSSASSATPNLTIKSPNLIIRGSSTYFSSTHWEKMTDIRRQYVIEVYRSPKIGLNLNGWGIQSQLFYINNCAQSATHKLT